MTELPSRSNACVRIDEPGLPVELRLRVAWSTWLLLKAIAEKWTNESARSRAFIVHEPQHVARTALEVEVFEMACRQLGPERARQLELEARRALDTGVE